MKIGSTDLNGSNSSFKRTNFIDVEANKPNIVRVFPPLFSLADKGAVTYFHKTHSVWLTNAKSGKQYPVSFKCILRKDKDKKVTQECAMCSLAERYQETYNKGKAMLDALPEGDSKVAQTKQLGEFLRQKVWNTQADGKNYLNVIGLDGKIGVLRVSFKQYEAFKARVTDLLSNWKTDATGLTGVYLNFTKASPFKGSKDVTFAVDAYMEQVAGPNGLPQMNFKYHQITDEVIAKMEKECEDLSLLYKEISAEDVSEIASKYEDKEALKAACDRIFGSNSPAPANDIVSQAAAAVAASAPVAAPVAPAPVSVDAVLASAAMNTAQVFAPQAPVAPAPAPVATAPVAPAFVPQAPAPVAAPSTGGIFGNGQLPQGGLSNVSDDEFAKLFG